MIGGDLLLIDQNFLAHSREGTTMFQQDANVETVSMFTAVILLLNAAISTDPFLMGGPFNCGVVQTLLICVFVLLLTMFSFKLFLQTWIFGSTYSYRDIWIKCFGKKAVFLPSALILVAYLSITILCTNEVYLDVLELYTKIRPNSNALDYKWVLIYIIVMGTTIPFMFHSRASYLYVLAYIGKFGLLVGVSAVVYNFVIQVKKEGFDPKNEIIFWNNKYSLSFDTFGGFNTVFFLLPVIHLVVMDMKNPSESRVIKTVWTTEIITAVICLITGLSAYFMFFSRVDDSNVLFYFPSNQLVAIIGRIGSLVSNMSLNTFYIWLISRELCLMLHPGSDRIIITRIASSMVVILFNIAMNFLDSVFVDIFGLMGNASFVFLAFVFPSMFFLKIYGFLNIKWALLAIFVLVIAIPASISNFIYEISIL